MPNPVMAYHSDVIHSFDWKSVVEHDVVFKMRKSVPSARYSRICNVLHLYGESGSFLLTESTDSMINFYGYNSLQALH